MLSYRISHTDASILWNARVLLQYIYKKNIIVKHIYKSFK
ncbi:hypothetical protein HMPREF1992_00245 [Selenomonas sp. oral taxon 892 str. F0426]|nr:hypothetical protein HMPREF1992_00245 [Selenomonas sp. oral taxon 892 str. F0426]